MKVNKQPSTSEMLLSQRSKDEVVLHTWQFELARRIAQVLEEQGMTQTEMAARTGLTHAQISALLHSDANPTLATLAKIAGHLDIQILSFTNTDAV
jgi:DNA-binding phage protein